MSQYLIEDVQEYLQKNPDKWVSVSGIVRALDREVSNNANCLRACKQLCKYGYLVHRRNFNYMYEFKWKEEDTLG